MLELSTPKIRRDQKAAAEFRPAKLEPWLAQLPRTDREAHAKWLYKALSTQNRLAIAPSVRLKLMELYIPPFREVQASLLADTRAIAAVPLHPHYRSKQEGMLAMLDALGTGYKIAVLDLATQRRGRSRRGDLALALQRAMYFLGQLIVASCEIYLRPPGGAWRELHQLYRCAEEQGLRAVEVPANGTPGESLDILKTYLRILLVGACEPFSLLPGEARRLHDLASRWCFLMELDDAGARPTQPGYFRINLKSDAPPLPSSKTAKPPDRDTRVLCTLEVARSMHEIMTQVNESVEGAGPDTQVEGAVTQADAELLRRAGRVLGEVDITRGSTRFEADQRLELIVGFESVCTACNGGRASGPTPPASPETEADTGPESEQFIDLAEPMLGVPTDGDAAGSPPPAQARSPGQSLDLVRADNQSAGGVCLVVPRSTDVRVKVGEIGACRFAGSSRWQLGVIRWMRVTSREIRFGIQFLGPLAKPIAAQVGEAGKRPADSPPPMPTAIWLPENPALKQPGSILLRRSPGPHPASVTIRDGDRAPLALRILQRIERTGAYDQFLVSVESPGLELQSSLSS